MTQRITSRKNPLLLHIRKLAARRSERREAGEFLGDGVKLLEEAVRWNAPLTAVVLSDGVEGPALPAETDVVRVPEEVMASISPMQAPQGALFLCRMGDTTLPARLDGSRYLVLDGLQDPGNVGTIWRTADALGADGLILTQHCVDPFSPKAVRATMGACFRLPVWEATPEELEESLTRSRLPLYATALRSDAQIIQTADLSRSAVVIGSEGQGVSQQLLERSAGALKIPMRARCESLNAAAAAAVVLWEMGR